MEKSKEYNIDRDSGSCRAVLVGIGRGSEIEKSLSELEGLAEAADVEVAAMAVQDPERISSATLIGSGKVEEIAEICRNIEADTVIFNEELSGIQIRNLEEALSVRVIDRTILILDIFAARAVSREGKLQVELAQLAYRMPRLLGFGRSLSRLGGGIGTRGPGEKKLESDRRHITKRMDDIKREMKAVASARDVQRLKRTRSGLPVAALVGYTNSGKSAVMNRLLDMNNMEGKKVGSEDILFATLDTAQRRICRENNREFILTDTVGFVSKLPHALVEAFKATLEEVKYADLLLHIVDASSGEKDFQIDVTDRTLEEIGAGGKKKILVYNKIDELDEAARCLLDVSGLQVSAATGENMDSLMTAIEDELYADRIRASLLIPYDRGEIVSFICEKAAVMSMEHQNDGTVITAEFTREDYSKVKEYDTL